MQIHVNEVTFEGNDPWTRQFNLCSYLFGKANDRFLTKQERENNLALYIEERQRLELGMY